MKDVISWSDSPNGRNEVKKKAKALVRQIESAGLAIQHEVDHCDGVLI